MNATKLLPIFPAKLWTCFTFLVQVCELVSTSSVGVCSWSGGQGDWCGLFHWTAPSSISPWNRLFDVQINVSLTIVNKLRFECKAFKHTFFLLKVDLHYKLPHFRNVSSTSDIELGLFLKNIGMPIIFHMPPWSAMYLMWGLCYFNFCEEIFWQILPFFLVK